jgi:gamma-tubulin complex component 3
LYFLYQISDSEEPPPPGLTSPFKSPTNAVKDGRNSDRHNTTTPTRHGNKTDEKVLGEAFAPGGLPKLPSREGGQRDRVAAAQAFTKTIANQRGGVALKTELLAENYVEIDPPETTLLRDLPFTLQGLSSSSLSFSSSSLKLPATLPPPIISLLHTLAEPSLLYRGLATFVQSSEGGLLGQSLRAAIGSELRSYLGLVATLEGQIRRALSSLDENEPRGGIGKAGVTLKRCVVWTREATMGLRLMSLIAEESKSKFIDIWCKISSNMK